MDRPQRRERALEAQEERIRFRGMGQDWTPGCFVCGGKHDLYANQSGFVTSKESGERIVALFEHGAFLDYRQYEPDWIQVKVGACKKHVPNLQKLYSLVMDDRDMIISAKIIALAISNEPESLIEGAPV
jgi:hypothetical protein